MLPALSQGMNSPRSASRARGRAALGALLLLAVGASQGSANAQAAAEPHRGEGLELRLDASGEYSLALGGATWLEGAPLP